MLAGDSSQAWRTTSSGRLSPTCPQPRPQLQQPQPPQPLPPGRLRTTRRRRSRGRLRGRLPRWLPRRRPKRRPRRTWTWLTRNRRVRLLRRPLRFEKFTFTGLRLELKAPENSGTDFNARNLPIDQSGIPTPGTWNRFLQNTWNGSPLSDLSTWKPQ